MLASKLSILSETSLVLIDSFACLLASKRVAVDMLVCSVSTDGSRVRCLSWQRGGASGSHVSKHLAEFGWHRDCSGSGLDVVWGVGSWGSGGVGVVCVMVDLVEVPLDEGQGVTDL